TALRLANNQNERSRRRQGGRRTPADPRIEPIARCRPGDLGSYHGALTGAGRRPIAVFRMDFRPSRADRSGVVAQMSDPPGVSTRRLGRLLVGRSLGGPGIDWPPDLGRGRVWP